MHHRLGLCRVAGTLLVLLLSACGGDEKDPVTTGISTTSINFSATAPDAATPAAQTVTATFGADVVHLAAIHSGEGIARVTYTLAGKTALLTIEPSAPSAIGAGRYTGVVAITGHTCANAKCSNLAAGNTLTLAVTYQVSPVVQLVAPGVATAGRSATAIIRGVGFQKYAIRGVTFGATPATSFTIVSNNELRAAHPALAAGNYPVQVDIPTHQGVITSTATLKVVEPTAYAAGTLSYPAAASAIRTLLYDAERSALVVATDANGGTLIRYPYVDGAWNAANSVTIGALQGVALTLDGAQLLAISTTALTPLDAVSLVKGTAIAAPSLATDNFLKNISVANTNRAVITTGISTSTATAAYLYDVRTAALTKLSTTLNNATPAASADGSRIVLIQGHAALTTAPSVNLFDASSNAFSASAVALNQTSVAPAMDGSATRTVPNGINVYDANLSLMGTLPATTLAVALKPDGKRAYTYDSAAAAVLTFDTSTDKDGNALPQIGTAAALAGNPGGGVIMTISPDGNTLFLAGSAQVVVQPTPQTP